jgi:hypothetical protein
MFARFSADERRYLKKRKANNAIAISPSPTPKPTPNPMPKFESECEAELTGSEVPDEEVTAEVVCAEGVYPIVVTGVATAKIC